MTNESVSEGNDDAGMSLNVTIMVAVCCPYVCVRARMYDYTVTTNIHMIRNYRNCGAFAWRYMGIHCRSCRCILLLYKGWIRSGGLRVGANKHIYECMHYSTHATLRAWAAAHLSNV